jgi:CRP/FNR family transcriptional regulator
MLSTAPVSAGPFAPALASRVAPATRVDRQADLVASRHVADTLKLLQERLAPRRRVVHAGDVVYSAGERFAHLCILNAGFFKMINMSADGREQVVSLKFRGDWLGFDGIAGGAYSCDAVAMDTGEIWMIRYDELLAACRDCPQLLTLLHEAMSRQIDRDRESMMSLCTLPADARVAEFLRRWADVARPQRPALGPDHAAHDARRDRQLPRHDARDGEPRPLEAGPRRGHLLRREGRRDIRIPDVAALSTFVSAAWRR